MPTPCRSKSFGRRPRPPGPHVPEAAESAEARFAPLLRETIVQMLLRRRSEVVESRCHVVKALAIVASWSSGHPWLAVLVVLGLTAGLGAGFAQAESGRVIDQFIPDDLAAVETRDRIEATFGASEPAFVLLRSDDPGAPDLIRAIAAMDAELSRDALVSDVASIADHVPTEGKSDAEIQAAWNEAKARPDIAGAFIRDDATLVRVSYQVNLEPEAITASLDAATANIQVPGVTVQPAGLAYLEQAQSEGGAQDVQFLLPLSVVVIAVILAILFRRPADVVIPIATTFVALAWAYGILTWAQMPLSPLVFSVMPLILGLGVDYMLHIVYAFRATGKGPHPARFAQVGERIGAPVFFTAITTLIGFGSFLVSRIPQVRSWGLLLGGGALSAFILGFLLLPALYRLSREPRRELLSTHRFLGQLGAFLVRRRVWVLAVLGVATLGLGAAATQVDFERQLEVDVDENDPASSALNDIEERFGGQSIVQFLVPRSAGPTALEALEADVAAIQGIGFVDGPATRITNSQGNPDGYPANDPRLEGVSSANAWLVSAGYATNEERDLLPLLEATSDEHGAQITGRGYIQIEAEGAVLDSLLLSTGVAFGLVLLLLLLIFRRPGPALLAFTPLALVIVWQLGIQSLVGIPLNSVTGITAAMVIGIGVDYSLHLMSDVQRNRKAGHDGPTSAIEAVQHVGQPVLAGTITTVLAFTVLAFSQLSQLQQFGTVAAIVVTCAFIVTMGLIPAIVAFQGGSKSYAVRGMAEGTPGATITPRFDDPDVQEWYEETVRRGE